MLVELKKETYFKVKTLFNQLPNHLSIQGVIENINPGRIFVDHEKQPQSAFLISPEGFYLSGKVNVSFYNDLYELLKQDVFKKPIEQDDDDYVVYYSKDLETTIPIIFKDMYPMKDQRHYYEIDINTYSFMNVSDHVIKVDQQLMNSHYEGLSDIKEHIEDSFTTLQNFYKHGLGYVYLLDNEIISWCISDTVVDNRCELGIETDDDHRQKGYALQVLFACLNHCKKQSIQKVGWQCWKSNVPSIKTALKVGFKFIEEIDIYFGFYKPLANYITNGNHYLMKDRNDALSAKFYEMALDKDYGQFWHYYNAACLLYNLGNILKAKVYYQKAVEKGWKGLENWNSDWLVWVYHDSNAQEIENALKNL